MTARGNDAIGRFMAEQTAKMRRCADRAAYIAAKFKRRKTGRQRRRRTARRAARCMRRIMRIVGCAVQVVIALKIGA